MILGVKYALSNFKIILFFYFVVVFFNLLLTSVFFKTTSNVKFEFLYFVLSCFTESFLIFSLLSCCLNSISNNETKLLKVCIQTFRLMPKVFLSYFILLIMLSISFPFIIPFIILLFIFIWAPFSIATDVYQEAFSTEASSKSELENLESLFSLGFLKSANFSIKRPYLTLKVTVLYWFANVFPQALTYFFSGVYQDLSSILLSIVLTDFFLAVAYTVIAFEFCMYLPSTKLKNLDLEFESIAGDTEVKNLKGNVFTSVLLLLALSSTVYIVSLHEKKYTIPKSVTLNVENVSSNGETLQIKLRLSDFQYNYVWLKEENFVVKFSNSEKEVFRKVNEVKLTLDDGRVLEPDNIKANLGSVNIILSFIKPKELLPSYKLYYFSNLGIKGMVTGEINGKLIYENQLAS